MCDSCAYVKVAAVAAGAAALGFFVGKKLGAKGPSNFLERLDHAKAKSIQIITAAEAKSFLAGHDGHPGSKPLVIDVRDSGDVSDGIKGAINIPLSNLVFAADQDFTIGDDIKIDGEVKIAKGTKFCHASLQGSKDKPILVSCGLGGQALIGAGILADYGFTNVKVVDGGNIAWMNAKGETCDCMK
eukprot:TRINITY_DN97939_c0_g1_i1.p1 TRINITY_DN97939_c0_g1~~TRINITY_DN97939_c0_g1_i1.p1  ORF type:complete len:186 (-),score=54.92 TRINITY_DN97939_c0_g1_i1:204-761(-)